MNRLLHVVLISVLLVSLSTAQSKQWSYGLALGSSTQLSLSYNMNPQWQLSFIVGQFGDLRVTSSDRIGLSAIYYFNTSDNPLFIGFAPGYTTTATKHPFIAVIPAGVQHKFNEDFSMRLAAEFFITKNELDRTAGGVGISVGGFIYF